MKTGQLCHFLLNLETAFVFLCFPTATIAIQLRQSTAGRPNIGPPSLLSINLQAFRY